MTRRKWVAATLVVVAVCAMVVLAAFRNDIAIGYHRRAMVRAWAKIREVGARGNQMPWIESYEHHRDELVRCGYFIRREFPLALRPPETNRVWKQLKAEFPDHGRRAFDAEMESTQWGGSENKITVWDRPDRMRAWEAAIRRYDVPDRPTTAGANAAEAR